MIPKRLHTLTAIALSILLFSVQVVDVAHAHDETGLEQCTLCVMADVGPAVASDAPEVQHYLAEISRREDALAFTLVAPVATHPPRAPPSL